MKKLLSILGVATLVVSAPLSVVSCKKQKVTNENEFDYEALKNNLFEATQQIFNSTLKNDFDNYFFVSQDGGDNGVDYPFGDKGIDWFITNEEKITNLDSNESLEVQKDISEIINWDKLEEEINSEILSNVNYKPILVDGKTPLKDGYTIEDIRVVSNDGKDSVAIYVTIGANFYFLNEKQEQQVERLIDFKTSITITENKLDAISLNEIKNNYVDTLNSVENANSFEIKSDKGNLRKTAESINEKHSSNEVFNQFKNIIGEIKFKDELVSFDDNFIIETNKKDTVDAVVYFSRVTDTWLNSNSECMKTIQSALRGNKSDELKLIEELSSNDSKWKPNYVYQTIGNIKELSAQYKDFSEIWNSFNLEFNLMNKSKTFKNSLNNSNFKLNPNEERNYIALFRSTISSVKFTYKGKTYDLPDEQIVVKQRPKSENTKVLYKQFITDSFHFQQQFFGYNDGLVDQSNQFVLNKPTSLMSTSPGKVLNAIEVLDLLVEANPKAAAFLEPLDLNLEICEDHNIGNAPTSKMTFNKNGDIFFWRSANPTDYWFNLKNYFFPADQLGPSYNYKDFFTLGNRNDVKVKDNSNLDLANSSWRFG
ncbi:lipoprotein [Spiroplasma alleghenense]|uniref:Lipoprotein n=1 Tax=Spiroplasma alleghenense TaxID=216931 RepID=A0A345Z540_9MOLU|nr:lipoprotein [Spiroplasma alleghenense]AXK51719.1 hypothetical protein SALLE_v1c10490 [Spiroplasma alleghenense]